ncbi:MAG: methyltransferase [Methylovirgula sp.]
MTRTSLSPAGIMQLGTAFWGSKVLLSAVELGLFSALAGGPQSLEDLTAKLGLDPRGARDFLDALVALKMLDRHDGRYGNTLETDLYLDRAKPTYVGGILEMANHRLYPFWGGLTDALRTGEAQNEVKHGGQNLFAELYADPDRLAGFLKAMTGVSLPSAKAIAGKFPWEKVSSFVDIGCAQGGLSAELAVAHPHLQGIGFDLSPVRPMFEKYCEERSVAARVKFQAGDFFEEPLPSADVIVMGHILHDWDLQQKQMLVAKAYAALPKGGFLLVYDAMIDNERRENAFGLLMSLNMLIETPGGFDYTGADCIGWMKDAGFAEARIEHLQGPYSVAIGTKPSD